MTDFTPSQCRACERRITARVCEAFPGSPGIPDLMLFGGGDHRVPLSGDHGKQFLLSAADDAEQEFTDWQQVYGAK
jgi:hypothetical protein